MMCAISEPDVGLCFSDENACKAEAYSLCENSNPNAWLSEKMLGHPVCGIFGTFHHVSKEHLARYCDEFSFRYSARNVTDANRAGLLVKGAEGKRLTYKQPTGMGAES